METPYELLIRFNPNGTVSGMISKTLIQINGRVIESDPVPISSAADPAFIQFAQAFSASVLAERDSLLIELDETRVELDEVNEQSVSAIASLQLELQTARETNASIQSELESARDALASAMKRIEELENPPVVAWRIAPNDFVKRFTPNELIATQMSDDPIVILGRTDIQTIITFIDLKDPQTAMYIGRLVQLGIITSERASQIMSY